jgi:hypothetical protein
VREKEREGGRERKRERERCPEILFSKGMAGALAPFSYLVFYNMLKRDLKSAIQIGSLHQPLSKKITT